MNSSLHGLPVKVGDPVYDLAYGAGKVVGIDTTNQYPITVELAQRRRLSYSVGEKRISFPTRHFTGSATRFASRARTWTRSPLS